MAILGVGVDIVNIDRILSLVKRRGITRFADRILSRDESSTFRTYPSNKAQFLAVRCVIFIISIELSPQALFRFAVKEAAYKALYPSFQPTWKQLSFHTLKSGKPTLYYESTPIAKPTDSSSIRVSLHASISHEENYVVAMVVAET